MKNFWRLFENCLLEEFHHADHIRMAWLYLREYGYEIESVKVKEGMIKKYSTAKNANALDHETITEFWIRLVQHVIMNHCAETFGEFFSSFRPLQDSKSIYRHYSKEYLMTESARSVWCHPDVQLIPRC